MRYAIPLMLLLLLGMTGTALGADTNSADRNATGLLDHVPDSIKPFVEHNALAGVGAALVIIMGAIIVYTLFYGQKTPPGKKGKGKESKEIDQGDKIGGI